MARATPPQPDTSAEKSRGRGRPAKTDADHARTRSRIIEATAAAYGETGFHGLSVRTILEKAELSRPTFYRHFSNAEEPAREMILLAHRGLSEQLAARIPQEASAADKMSMAIDLYLDWCESIGPLLKPFYTELHDPQSPVSELRQDILRRIADFYVRIMEDSGYRLQNRLLVDLMISGVEFLGYRYHLETRKDAPSLRMTRDAMLRMMVCTFSDPEQWLQLLRKKGWID